MHAHPTWPWRPTQVHLWASNPRYAHVRYSLRHACSSILDDNNPDLVHIKVGRTNTMNHRTAEHFHNCPSGKPLLLDYYPRPASASQAKLSLARIKPGVKVPFADMLEELIHIELTDIAANTLPSGAILSGQCLGVNR